MGLFGFLKKEKKETVGKLPPLPDMGSLPPLPTQEGPTPQPPMPPSIGPDAPEELAPSLDIPDIKHDEKEESQLFPDLPDEEPETTEEPPVKLEPIQPLTQEDDVPEQIPDLEDLPEPPAFRPETSRVNIEDIHPAKELIKHTDIQPIITPKRLPEHIPPLEGFKPVAPMPMPQDTLVRHRTATGPLFVRMDEYKAVLDDIEQMKTEFKENENIYVRMEDYRIEQDKHFEKFHQSVEDIQRKLLYVDKILFEIE